MGWKKKSVLAIGIGSLAIDVASDKKLDAPSHAVNIAKGTTELFVDGFKNQTTRVINGELSHKELVEKINQEEEAVVLTPISIKRTAKEGADKVSYSSELDLGNEIKIETESGQIHEITITNRDLSGDGVFTLTGEFEETVKIYEGPEESSKATIKRTFHLVKKGVKASPKYQTINDAEGSITNELIPTE